MDKNTFPTFSNDWIKHYSFDIRRYNWGSTLYNNGHVMDLKSNFESTYFSAQVRSYNGIDIYDVAFKIVDKILLNIGCTCGHFKESPKVCKHIVAVLKAVQHESLQKNSTKKTVVGSRDSSQDIQKARAKNTANQILTEEKKGNNRNEDKKIVEIKKTNDAHMDETKHPVLGPLVNAPVIVLLIFSVLCLVIGIFAINIEETTMGVLLIFGAVFMFIVMLINLTRKR